MGCKDTIVKVPTSSLHCRDVAFIRRYKAHTGTKGLEVGEHLFCFLTCLV